MLRTVGTVASKRLCGPDINSQKLIICLPIDVDSIKYKIFLFNRLGNMRFLAIPEAQAARLLRRS